MSSNQKERIRHAMRDRRRGDSVQVRQRESGRIQRAAMDLAPVSDASMLCGYMPLEPEVQIQKLLNLWVLADRPVLVPAFDADTEAYRWARYATAGPWMRGKFGVTEPAEPDWREPDERAVVMVPGLAFDRTGQRLGHGKGFYDRLLASFTGTKVGLGFSYQLIDQVPAEPHDVAMQWVITELEAHKCRPAGTDTTISTTSQQTHETNDPLQSQE